MEKTLGIALGIYALILWIVLLFIFRKGYKEWKQNRASRLLEFPARVVDKRASSESGPDGFVTFEYRGRQEEFSVPRPVHDSVRIGQEGILQLRRGAFEGFIPRSETDRADDIYRRMVKG